MRPAVALLLAAACLAPRAAHAQQAYAGVLLEYLGGDANAALNRLRALDRGEIEAGVAAFDTTRSSRILAGAAAMHTEAALRPAPGGGLVVFQGFTSAAYHLQVATAIVEFGEVPKVKTNTPLIIQPQHAIPVSADFRRLWYCAVITVLENNARMASLESYLKHAVALFPAHPEIQLLAGIAEEMRGSPRTASFSRGDRRKSLDNAEKHYRAALAAAPERLEIRLRLGHVLQQGNALGEARAMLAPLTADRPDLRLLYLAALFLGGVEDALGHTDAALAAYDRGAAAIPSAQAARLAASELRHRTGDHRAAATAVPAAAGDANTFDPWWTYIFGEYWRVTQLLDGLREMRRS